MRLQHTSVAQDAILSDCESFGGNAAEAVEVAQDLDNQLSDANTKIELLTNDLEAANKQIGELERQIEQLTNQQ